jgi:hypothetical protein
MAHINSKRGSPRTNRKRVCIRERECIYIYKRDSPRTNRKREREREREREVGSPRTNRKRVCKREYMYTEEAAPV